jgi:diguanylate cyclase (GGDEF)-like protein
MTYSVPFLQPMDTYQSQTHRGSILIVDDTPDNLRLLSNLLTKRGYDVRATVSGQMAITVVKAAPPELMLLDICMPQMNGYEVCRHLKSDPITQDIPIIFISALDELANKVEAFEVGGVDYITKPFQVAEVVARVNTHLTLRRLQQQLQEQNLRLQQEVCERMNAEAALQAANRELQRLACIDGLTQISNRLYFDQRLRQEWLRLSREKQSLAIILCDVDHFKLYNDYYGHQAGDECLKQVAQTICNQAKRPADLVARYGGEEFVVMLSNTDLEGAVTVAEHIKLAVEGLHIPHAGSQVSSYVTLSMGIANTIPQMQAAPEKLIAAADRSLYMAKARGRNTFCFLDSGEIRAMQSSDRGFEKPTYYYPELPLPERDP